MTAKAKTTADSSASLRNGNKKGVMTTRRVDDNKKGGMTTKRVG
jgi:hypothetical protein